MTTRPYVIDQLISAKSIAARVEALAQEIHDAFEGTDKLVVVGGAMGETVLDKAGVKSVAAMPSRDELVSQIAGMIGAPAANLAAAIAAPASNIAGCIEAVEEKGEAA